MQSVISIDWLTVHCEGEFGDEGLYQRVQQFKEGFMLSNYKYRLELLPYNSRQFSRLYRLYLFTGKYTSSGEEDYIAFAEIQAKPNGVIDGRTVLVKLCNRFLYEPHGLDMFRDVLNELHLTVKRISRLDICADFNELLVGSPAQFIYDYARGVYRHVGRSIGTTNFTQKGGDPIIYNALSFGKHTSDTRVYLYNKTLELKTVKDKPYIRDKWRAASLDVSRDVWRLEVSITGKALEYHDRESGQKQKITFDSLFNWGNVTQHYLTFVESLFAFVNNREGITNITREPRIQLLPEIAKVKRWAIREDVKGATVGDKITIKRLYLSGKLYHGDMISDQGVTLTTAMDIARSRDLGDWFAKNVEYWEKEYRNI